MIKNAFLSIKKNIGRSLLLFVLMCLIANLVIAGLSIKSATTKSMEQVRTSLGSEVTFSYNMKNMMDNREKGSSMESVMDNITVDMADQLKDLKYVENYNYTVQVGATSEDIDPVAMSEETTQETKQNIPGMNSEERQPMMDDNDFTIVGNTTMEYLESFVNENYVLTSGHLLSQDDAGTKNCVIESTLASDNDLEVGDTLTVTSNDKTETLEIVGIFEIETSSEMGRMMSNRQSPMNQIYTDISLAQTLNGSDTDISSATYYLDDPEHIDAFKELAASQTDIDFETYTLDDNDMIYQRSISSLENMDHFATIFLWVVIIAGSLILCLVLVLTMRGRFYEFGVLLSLGQTKLKIGLQQLIEICMIAVLAFCLSLTTGKMVSNVVNSMLESSQTNQNQMIMEITPDSQENKDKPTDQPKNLFDQAMTAPENEELDVSLTGTTIVQLAQITGAICIVSVLLPAVYILRLSPREILTKKEG